MKNVDAMFFTGRPAVRQEDSLPVPEQSEVHNVEPKSMADLLHHSLLMGSISPLERLSRSQQRLAKGGIPPPVHIFPYSIMAEASSPSPLANIEKTTQSTKTLGRLFLPSATPEKSVVGHKAMRYLIADPGNLNSWGHLGEHVTGSKSKMFGGFPEQKVSSIDPWKYPSSRDHG